MPIPLPKYAQIKNNYCVGYLGTNSQIVLQLKRARPFVEKEFPGLKLFIACQDSLQHLLEGEEHVIPSSQLQEQVSGYAFAYYRQLDENPDAVKSFLIESNIPFPEEILSLQHI